jgi:hypothetical protein
MNSLYVQLGFADIKVTCVRKTRIAEMRKSEVARSPILPGKTTVIDMASEADTSITEVHVHDKKAVKARIAAHLDPVAELFSTQVRHEHGVVVHIGFAVNPDVHVVLVSGQPATGTQNDNERKNSKNFTFHVGPPYNR